MREQFHTALLVVRPPSLVGKEGGQQLHSLLNPLPLLRV